LAHVFLSEDGRWRFPQRGRQAVDPAYIEALIAVEDKRFYSHPGVDPLAMARAVVSNLRSGRVVSGASTLTMQLSRLLMEPRPRNMRSKIIEALRALQLELRLSKEEILYNWVRFASFGRNVEGVSAASWVYFGRPASSSLTRGEILTLLAVPQAPARRYPAARNKAALARAREQLALRLGFADAAARPAPTRMRPLPRHMPHAARWLRPQPKRGSSRDIIRTTIDPGTQRLAERLLARHHQQAKQRGIHNAAVVVADHRTGQIKALVGGFDWQNKEHGGQIPGFAVARSTGSLLKPFILSLAMDKGLALPGYLVRDLPTRFGRFFPRNYGGRHFGLLRAHRALALSLNLPFVSLLEQVGVQDLLGLLRSVGFGHMRARGAEHYGLAAAVGGVEATLLEIAELYAALAGDGRHRPLSAVAELPRPTAQAAMAPGTAYLIRQALASKGRPGFPGKQGPEGTLFWKTGTSSNSRDAWALGGGPRHVVGVWFGNLNGKPAPALVGARQAGPLLFDLLEGLGEGRRTAMSAPPGLQRITVCGYSGYPAGKACKERTKVQAPAGFAERRSCPFHMELLVDVQTGQAVTPACKGERRVVTRSYLVWPADLRRWWAGRQRLPPLPPPFAPGCAPPPGLVAPPRILSPPRGRVLVSQTPSPRRSDRSTSAHGGSSVPLLAWSPGSSRLRWHVNGHYLGTVQPEQPLYHSFPPGRHHVFVMDEAGQSASSELLVVGGAIAASRR